MAPGGETSTAGTARLIAHRGGVVTGGRGENSRAALEAAIEQGYYGIETDLRETADGAVICHHDPTMARDFGEQRPIAALSWNELRGLRRVGSGEPPLLFAELVERCAGRLVLMLDIKEAPSGNSFFEQIRTQLAAAGLLPSTYVIGTAAAREFFLRTCLVGVRAGELATLLAHHDRGPQPATSRFLFDHGQRLPAAVVNAGQSAGVEVVPSINWQHFRLAPRWQARRHLQRLYGLGVRTFQIDDPFADFVGGAAAGRAV